MANTHKIEDYDRVLVVEGYSDLAFFNVVLEDVGAGGKVFIHELRGKGGLRVKLDTLLSPGLLASKSAVAVIIDADDKPETTRNSLQDILSEITKQSVIDGEWSNGTPKIGLFIVPGENQPGEIETLVWNSWANDESNAAAKLCIENYRDCMKAAGAIAHSPAKGLIGTLLAVKSDEDPRLGPGARDNAFDLTRPELRQLTEFLAHFSA